MATSFEYVRDLHCPVRLVLMVIFYCSYVIIICHKVVNIFNYKEWRAAAGDRSG